MNFLRRGETDDDGFAEDEKGDSSEGHTNAAAASLTSSMAQGSLGLLVGANLSAAQQALLLASSNRNTGVNTDRSALEIAMLQRMRANNTNITQGYLGLGPNLMSNSLLQPQQQQQQQLQQSHNLVGGQDLSQLMEARMQLLRQQILQQQLGQQHQRNMQLAPYLSNASQLSPALSQHQQNLQMAMSRSSMANARAAMAARNYDSGLFMRDMQMAALPGQSFPQAQHQPSAFGGSSGVSSYMGSGSNNLPFASLQHTTQARDLTSLSASTLGRSEASARGSPASTTAPQGDDPPEMQDAEYFELFGFNDEDGVQIINETFPHKLYRMLFEVERKGLDDVVSFFPHGKAFIVKNPKRYVEEIMPKYFSTSRMSSFQRQLNLYGFQRIDDGPEKGGFVHQFFQKGQRSLCNKIKRQRNKPASSPAPSAADTLSARGGLAARDSGISPSVLGGATGGTRGPGMAAAVFADTSIPQNEQAQAVLRRLLRGRHQEGETNNEADN